MELSAYIYAFIIGGAICVIGQLLISLTRLTSARVLVLFVVSGVVLTGLGLYEPLVRLAGAGATTPLTGFGWPSVWRAASMSRSTRAARKTPSRP